MALSDYANGQVATAKKVERHKDAGRGVEVGLPTDGTPQQATFPAPACDWWISDRGLLAIKDDKGDEIAHVAAGQWCYVAHPGVVTVL